MQTVCVHSFKGGTGKTSLIINIAAMLAMKGYDITLLDFDFGAPSLHTIFNVNPEYYLNDFISEKCKVDDLLVDLSSRYSKCEGKFTVGFANPETDAIRFMITQGRKWQMKAIGRVMFLRRALDKNHRNDFLFLDTSPGVSYNSVNAIVASDKVLLVVKFDNSDFDGTLMMLRGIHSELERETHLIMNKIPLTSEEIEKHSSDFSNSDLQATQDDYFKFLKERFSTIKGEFFNIAGVIPCYCSVTLGRGEEILAFSQPDHPFIKGIEEILIPNIAAKKDE
ncbi:MAG: MinD/ParA family ATP-binding protein [Candidatus Hodarchaeales archaeon]